MYKLIAVDLDETLLNNDGTICKRNLDAVQKLIEAGKWFVPCSGRGYATIQGTLKDLGLYQKENQYIVGFNGGMITENKGNRELYYHGITYDETNMFFQKGMSFDVCMHIYTKDVVYIWNFNPGERSFLSGRQQTVELQEPSIEFLKDEPLVKILYQNTDVDYLHRIAKELEDITGPFDVSYSSNRYLEFNRAGINKGAGLRKLAEILGIDISEIIAVGDNNNDMAMIRAAGLGAGVANCTDEVRRICDYVSEADNEGGGVAEIIEKFML